MKFSLPTLALAASLLASAEGCLTLSGVVSANRLMMLSLVDNGISVCSFWGSLTGGQQWLTCQNGYASWVNLGTGAGGITPGAGTCAYSTAHGANNYRFQVHSQQVFTGNPDPALSVQWNLSAREYC